MNCEINVKEYETLPKEECQKAIVMMAYEIGKIAYQYEKLEESLVTIQNVAVSNWESNRNIENVLDYFTL